MFGRTPPFSVCHVMVDWREFPKGGLGGWRGKKVVLIFFSSTDFPYYLTLALALALALDPN